jgi:ribulose-phosphate 3-epimerase
MLIVPAIIPKTFADIEDRVRIVRSLLTRVQVDVLDGQFAPSVSWPYNGEDATVFQALSAQERGLPEWELMSYEIDMMVTEPEAKIDAWISAGAETLIIHIESTTKLKEIIERAAERGVEVALALKPSTNIELLAPWIDRIAFVQCMGNDKIGYHGVELDERVLAKISEMRARWPALSIGVDIGVNLITAPLLAQAGATRLASGSAIFKAEDPGAAIKQLSRA